MPYRFLLFDLDGTLLDPDRAIRPANRAALARVMARGIRVGLATGRPPRSVAPYVEAAGLTGPLILFNGAMVWDVSAGRAVHQAGLPRNDAARIIELALACDVHVNVYMGDEIWVERVTETSRRSENKDGVPHRVVGDLARAVRARDDAPVKLMLIDEVRDVGRLAQPIRAAIAHPCTLVRSEPTYLEILAPGVCKGSALSWLAGHYDIAPGDIMAFGDEQNDIELLRECGLGVAMGNANPAVTEVADVQIGDHATDAIAEFLQREFDLIDSALVRRS